MDNQQSYDLTVETQIKYIRYANQKSVEGMDLIHKADKEIATYMATMDVMNPDYKPIQKILEKQHSEVLQFVQETMDEIALMAATVEVTRLARRDENKVKIPSKVDLFSAVRNTIYGGAPMIDWIKQHNLGDRDRVLRTIKERVKWGDNRKEIRSKILGTTKRYRKDGIRDMTRRGLDTLINTAVMHAVNSAKEAVYLANTDIVFKLHWVSVLDTRTSDVCRNQHGRVFNVGEGPRPPLHPRCRSIIVPTFANDQTTKTRLPRWQQETWPEWLARQEDEVQLEALGKKRFQLYKSGTPVNQFYNADGEKYTLKDLQARLPEAFRRAGL